jgi:hypothetical protein
MAPENMAARTVAAHVGAEPGEYVLATVHRTENTDDPQRLQVMQDELGKLGLAVLFPLYPRLGSPPPGVASLARRTGSWSSPADHRTLLGLAGHGRLIMPTPPGCRRNAGSSGGRSSWSGTPQTAGGYRRQVRPPDPARTHHRRTRTAADRRPYPGRAPRPTP